MTANLTWVLLQVPAGDSHHNLAKLMRQILRCVERAPNRPTQGIEYRLVNSALEQQVLRITKLLNGRLGRGSKHPVDGDRVSVEAQPFLHASYRPTPCTPRHGT